MAGLRIGSLFSGYSGLDMAVQAVLGGELVFVSDVETGPCKVLAYRHPEVPNLRDITAVDWDEVALKYGPIHVLTGGFPCTDVSHAGKREGLKPGTRSGLWAHMRYAISVLRPRLVVIENVRGLLSAVASRSPDAAPVPDAVDDLLLLEEDEDEDAEDSDEEWDVRDLGSGDGDVGGDERAGPVLLRALGAVLGDLAGLGFDAEWVGVRAADVGAPHGRFRVFIVAWPAADASDVGHERGGAARGRRLGPADDGGAAPAADADDGEPHEQARAGGPADGGPAAGRGVVRPGGRVAADSDGPGLEGRAHPGVGGAAASPEGAGRAERPGVGVDVAGAGRHAAADAEGDGRDEGWPEPEGVERGPDAAERGDEDDVCPDCGHPEWVHDADSHCAFCSSDRCPPDAPAADAGGERHGGGETPGGLGRLDRPDEGRARQRQRTRQEPGDRGAEASADADGERRYRRPPGQGTGREAPVRVEEGDHLGDGGRPRGDAAADADSDGREGVGRVDTVGRDAHGRRGPAGPGAEGEPEARAGAAAGGDAAADTPGVGQQDEQAGGGAAGQHVGSVAGAGDRDSAGGTPEGVHVVGRAPAVVAWGPYEAAIRRWERVLGRPAPPPTAPGTKGQPRLNPAFVEFMQGLPEGWVMDVPGITRNEALRLFGNGVVPQQAAAALRILLARVVGPA